MSTAAQQKSRAAGGSAAPPDRGLSGDTEEPSGPTRKVPGDKFTAAKLQWIEDVATDVNLSLLARTIGAVLATKHLNRGTRDAWPAIGSLAELVGRSVTQVTTALKALEATGYLEIDRTKGGQNRTNHYRPLLKPLGKPGGKMREKESMNPSDFRSDTPRKTEIEPLGKPGGNPLIEPYDEPMDGHPARPMGLRSMFNGSGSAPSGASPTHHQRRVTYTKGQEINHPDHGECSVEHIAQDHLIIRSMTCGAEYRVGRSENGEMSDAPF